MNVKWHISGSCRVRAYINNGWADAIVDPDGRCGHVEQVEASSGQQSLWYEQSVFHR